MIPKRALRRHHYQRRKQKAAKMFQLWGEIPEKKDLGLYANTMCRCSCSMCGNPRRHFGEKTIQEVKLCQI